MSIDVMKLVIENGPENSADRHALLMIAWHINEKRGDKDTSFPSIATLAQECCVKPRAMQYTIKRLEEAGWITTSRSKGRHSNRYTVDLVKLSTLQPSAEFNPATECASTLQPTAPDREVDREEDKESAQAREVSSDLDEFLAERTTGSPASEASPDQEGIPLTAAQITKSITTWPEWMIDEFRIGDENERRNKVRGYLMGMSHAARAAGDVHTREQILLCENLYESGLNGHPDGISYEDAVKFIHGLAFTSAA